MVIGGCFWNLEVFICELDVVREVEETEDASFKLQERSLKAHLSNGYEDESIKKDLIEVRLPSYL